MPLDRIINGLLPVGILLTIALWEYFFPCRETKQSRLYRWSNTVAIRIFGKIFFMVFVPLTMMQLASWCQAQGIGLFNHLAMPNWLLIALTILLLDLSAYAVHAAAHLNQILWRAHRTHHLDTEYDITTALRTHPLDDCLNMIGETAVILLFGLHPDGVFYYAVFSGFIVKFSHANVMIWDRLDRVLRWVVVTPNMHRIHHSAKRHENDSNFCTHFTFWDRLFGTYRAYAEEPQGTMTIGLYQFRDPSEIRIDKLLLRPFHNKE